MKKPQSRFKTGERAKAYRDLFERWSDWWTPKAPVRMIIWAIASILTLYTIIQGIRLFAAATNDLHPAFEKAAGMIICAFFILFSVQLWWSYARDAKRLVRINHVRGERYESLDAARIGTLSAYFKRDLSQFRNLANELHQLTTLQSHYGLRATPTFKRIVHGLFDPTGKQRVVALVIATLAILGAIVIRADGATDEIMKLFSIGPAKLLLFDVLAALVLWLLFEYTAFFGRSLEKLAERMDLSSDAAKAAAIRYVVRDLLMLEDASDSK